MSSPSSIDPQSNPELRSLFEISRLPQPQTHLQDYFNGVMAILSEYFSTGYSALILSDVNKDSLHVEALYGMGKETHPNDYHGRKGVAVKVLESRQPAVIQNLSQEPLYDEVVKGTKRAEKIRPPLLCIPLVFDDEPLGVININPLYGSRNEFKEDFQFLSILSSILSLVIKTFQLKKKELLHLSGKRKAKSSFLDELLDEKLSEVLQRIDPYVEAKAKLGIFDDIISVVEKILIKSALERMGHVQVTAAKFLGINRNTLRKKMKEFKIKTR